MKNEKLLSYGRHFINDDDIEAVVSVLRSDFLTQGPLIEEFESAVAKRSGARYAVAFSSGTAALHGAAWAAGAGKGDVGVTQAITFCASANMFRYCGADVHLTDIDADSLNMCPESLAREIDRLERQNSTVRAVVPVHMGGLSVGSREIREVAGNRIVVEDASHSFGSFYEDGQPVGCGAYSDISVFSFHPVKPITTAEGGVAVTNDPELWRRMKLLRSHGIEKQEDRFVMTGEEFSEEPVGAWYYEQQYLGYNYRLSDIHAALGLAQLVHLDGYMARRIQLACDYDKAFAGHPYIRPLQAKEPWRQRSAHHLYVVMIDFASLGTDRATVMRKLASRGIGTQVHYIPIYKQPYYREQFRADVAGGHFRNAEKYYEQALTLPLHMHMQPRDIAQVVAAVQDVIDEVSGS